MGGGGGDVDRDPTDEEKALAEVAIDRWNDYQTRLKPYEGQYMDMVQKSEGDFGQARGAASTAVTQSFQEPRKELEGNLFKRGVDPSSGAAMTAESDLTGREAKSRAAGVTESHQATEAQHAKGLQNIVKMGQGQSDVAQTGLGMVAQSAARDARHRAQMDMQEAQANSQAFGTVAGAGTSWAKNEFGDNASQA